MRGAARQPDPDPDTGRGDARADGSGGGPGDAAARVAVLVTAYRIGPVLADTLHAALAQRHVGPCPVLLVVDGCPETDTTGRIARRFLAAHPGRFHVLWLRNGGVARARNAGVAWLLRHDPGLAAVYCLDGDDLITPTALATGLATLRGADPARRVGWVVANKQNFGANRAWIETPATFRHTSYLAVNLSQPSCLYDTALFRAGVLWDETMRSGIEDWAFWLTAMAAGFEGVFNPDDVLFYRQLTGSRSTGNRRNDAFTIPYMRARHAALFTPRAVLADEHARAPRYAFGAPDAARFDCVSDPGEPGRSRPAGALADAVAGQNQRAAPGAYIYDPYFPDILCLMTPELRAALAGQGLLRGVLAAAEALIAQGRPVVAGRFAPAPGAVPETAPGAAPETAPGGAPETVQVLAVAAPAGVTLAPGAAPAFLMIKASALCAGRDAPLALAELDRRAAQLVIRAPALARHGAAGAGIDSGAALALLNRVIAAQPDERRIGAAQAQGGRLHVSGRRIAQHATLTRAALDTGPLFAQLARDGATRIAVILPADAAPDWDTLTAIATRPGGDIRLSLFSPGAQLARPPAALRAHVENRATLAPWLEGLAPARGHRMGVPLWDGAAPDIVARLAGVLAPFDHVVTHDLERLAPALLRLVALGVHTVNLEPPAPAPGAPGEEPLAALVHAAAFRRVICRTARRRDRLAALGCPRARLDLGAGAYIAALAGGKEPACAPPS